MAKVPVGVDWLEIMGLVPDVAALLKNLVPFPVFRDQASLSAWIVKNADPFAGIIAKSIDIIAPSNIVGDMPGDGYEAAFEVAVQEADRLIAGNVGAASDNTQFSPLLILTIAQFVWTAIKTFREMRK